MVNRFLSLHKPAYQLLSWIRIVKATTVPASMVSAMTMFLRCFRFMFIGDSVLQ